MYRYKQSPAGTVSDDPTPEYMNLLGMIFSMCGLMLKVSTCLFFVLSLDYKIAVVLVVVVAIFAFGTVTL